MSDGYSSRGRSIVHPPLPYSMGKRLGAALDDEKLQQAVDGATRARDRGRRQAWEESFGEKIEAMRDLAAQIKQHTLERLDEYLERFIDRARRAGAHVHGATDAAQARELVVGIARDRGCKTCVKSKSMVTEEIDLQASLEEAGIETIETDLGEFIIQLDRDAPSHIVTPMIHKDRSQVARAFEREIGARYTEDPVELTAIARAHLREKYRRADLGMSGANFLVAETGSLVLCTNEGNGGFCVSGPRVHIAVVGIEKLVPRLADLSVFLKLLARSATAQPITIYTTVLTGPKLPADHDGPEEMHIILVDNERSRLLGTRARDLLRCIRCGACLNACPVYRKAGGGHAYGAVYSGPIGAALMPERDGLSNYADLPQASSLCGACLAACPVKIDLPGHLVRLRTRAVEHRITRGPERLGMRLWAAALGGPVRYRLARTLQRLVLRRLAGKSPTAEIGTDGRWIIRGPGMLRGWTKERDFPSPPAEEFRSWWRAHLRETKGGAP